MCNACEHVYKKHVYKPNSGVFFILWAWNRAMDKSYTMFNFGRGCVLLFAGYIEQKNFVLQIWVKKL